MSKIVMPALSRTSLSWLRMLTLSDASSAEVGSSAMSSRGRSIRARAIITR